MHSGFHDVRFIVALVGGVIIALGLFIFMHTLITNNQSSQNVTPTIDLGSFVHVQRQPDVTHKQRVEPPPPPPKKQPEMAQVQTKVSSNVPTQRLPVDIDFDVGSLGGGTGVFISPNSSGPATNAGGYAPLTPMVRFRPLYPPRAQARGVQGTVTTCFTVEPDGSVSNPYVTGASSPQARRMLSGAALKTIRQWKFFPKKVDGKPVATSGVCQGIVFTIKG